MKKPAPAPLLDAPKPAPAGPNVVKEWFDLHAARGMAAPGFDRGKDAKAAREIGEIVPDALERAQVLKLFLIDEDKFVEGHALQKLPLRVHKYLSRVRGQSVAANGERKIKPRWLQEQEQMEAARVAALLERYAPWTYQDILAVKDTITRCGGWYGKILKDIVFPLVFEACKVDDEHAIYGAIVAYSDKSLKLGRAGGPLRYCPEFDCTVYQAFSRIEYQIHKRHGRRIDATECGFLVSPVEAQMPLEDVIHEFVLAQEAVARGAKPRAVRVPEFAK